MRREREVHVGPLDLDVGSDEIQWRFPRFVQIQESFWKRECSELEAALVFVAD